MSGENKGADQLCSYCTADLRLCFRICNCWFSHAAAQISVNPRIWCGSLKLVFPWLSDPVVMF